ncbi:hypothetical protein BofuT4_uP081180.1 [Botrytis cinerea T4]|uniref:Uncharacterized protein n=1 Tax=Botryotinia fuckeliana (strain T4) TaxID=999810 RepID=G2YL25_BOTF4|nr:hypothetical protein BofuT4_uP081180.1 [Botrytis cinerea T4]
MADLTLLGIWILCRNIFVPMTMGACMLGLRNMVICMHGNGDLRDNGLLGVDQEEGYESL